MNIDFQILQLKPLHLNDLKRLFDDVSNYDSDKFHPHAFDHESAVRITNYCGEDKYFGLFVNNILYGYGILRGWDDGYEIPYLGIYVCYSMRGLGLSRILMDHMHEYAFVKGAKQVRLKVYKGNERALALYRRMGYNLLSEVDNQYLLEKINTHSVEINMRRENEL